MPEVRLIDANAEVERLKSDYCKDCTRKGNYVIFGAACTPCWVKDAVEEFEDAPTIEAEPVRHGRWILKILPIGGGDKIRSYLCSECDRYTNMKFDFCPNCGRDMRATDTNVGGKGGIIDAHQSKQNPND